MKSPAEYRFSFGRWNSSDGADPLGTEARPALPHEEKFALYRSLGFEGVPFHDDVGPGLDGLSTETMLRQAGDVKAMLANQGLTPEIVAPQLGFEPRTVKGAYASNDPSRVKGLIERAHARVGQLRESRDYEALELYLLKHLLGA